MTRRPPWYVGLGDGRTISFLIDQCTQVIFTSAHKPPATKPDEVVDSSALPSADLTEEGAFDSERDVGDMSGATAGQEEKVRVLWHTMSCVRVRDQLD